MPRLKFSIMHGGRILHVHEETTLYTARVRRLTMHQLCGCVCVCLGTIICPSLDEQICEHQARGQATIGNDLLRQTRGERTS